MFFSRTRRQQPEKLAVVNEAKGLKIINQSSALPSTVSSGAKKTTPNYVNSNRSVFRTTINNTSDCIAIKSKFTKRKNNANLTAKQPFDNTVAAVKFPRDSNSVDTMGSKLAKQVPKFEKESRPSVTKASVAKKPQSQSLPGPSTRTRAASICRANTQTGRNHTCSTLIRSKNCYEEHSESQDNQRQFIEFGVQTNEREIFNHSLLVGDVKFLKPSEVIVNEIERQRKDLRTKQMLKATRKFEEHSVRQEEHLNGLKEFLEKSYVSKRPRKAKESLEEEQKLLNSMDLLLNREITKTESITDIKARIKRKEQELLNLFDNVQTTASLMSKNN